jgi:hypothetical protein
VVLRISLKRGCAVLGLAAVAGVTACAAGERNAPPPAPPHVAGLSTYSAPIGQPIDVYGTQLGAWRGMRTVLVFEGEFRSSRDRVEPVHAEFDVQHIDGGTMQWLNYGPYANPFGLRYDAPGRFRGTVGARVVRTDGTVVAEDPTPTEVEFWVEPSVVVDEFQPVVASCSGPVTRAFGQLPYRLRVHALGFEPRSIEYTVTAPSLGSEPIFHAVHATSALGDTVGTNNELVLPAVPEGREAYAAVIAVNATDAQGQSHGTAFAVAVRRPLGIFYDGNEQVAEFLPPRAVGACIPGGAESRTVGWDVSMSETRSRRIDVNWNRSWMADHTVTSGSMNSVTRGRDVNTTNSFAYGTTDGRSWNWSTSDGASMGTTMSTGSHANGSVTVGAEFGLFNVARGSASVTGSYGRDWMQGSHGDTNTSESNGGGGEQGTNTNESISRSVSVSETTTDTTHVQQSESMNMGGSVGQSVSTDVSSTESVSRSFQGFIPGGGFGVFYLQTIRILRRGLVVAYNLCGTPNVVGNADFSDWAWAPDLATGDTCTPLPASNLPPARCIIEPCSGN